MDKLQYDKHNANKGTDRGRDALARSIERYGTGRSVLVDKEGRLIAGNKTAEQAERLGLELVVVPNDGTKLVVVQRTDLDLETDAAARELAIADNRVAELDLAWDADVLREQLADDALDLGDLFTEEETAALLADMAGDDGESSADDVPPVDETNVISRLGDLWVLGGHRVLCGDSTQTADVARLLGAVQPQLMVTDPPYGVEYDASWRNDAVQAGNGARGAPGGRAIGKVANDDRADWREAWALFPGSVAYVWHAGTKAGVVSDSLAASGFEIRTQIIWAKQQFAISRGHYHIQHEPCWYAVRKGRAGDWIADRKQTSLWQIDKPAKSETGHSTQKPVECMARPMRHHGFLDVYDPFLGSGTSIIAAEQLGRRCFGMELLPQYCDVIVRRWELLTGRTAQRVPRAA